MESNQTNIKLVQRELTDKEREKWISYSTCDEDANSEVKCLNIVPTDTVLCVTGSGCRVLSLLASNPDRLIAVDFSAGQNYLLELKLAAIKHLDYDKLLQFLGVEPLSPSDRWAIFENLMPQISPRAVAYFQKAAWAIKKGILFTGTHELFYLRYTIPLMRSLFGSALDRLFAAQSITEQRLIYQHQIVGSLWNWIIRLGSSPSVLRLVLQDSHVFPETSVDPAEYVLARVNHTFNQHLARNNDWNHFIFYGNYPRRDCLPHFLLEPNYQAIRAATSKIEIVTADLVTYMQELPTQTIDKFSLSDVSSYLIKTQFDLLLADVARTGKPQGRLCYRNFLSKLPIPANLEYVLKRDRSTCEDLDHNDTSFVYTFEVATILPSQ